MKKSKSKSKLKGKKTLTEKNVRKVIIKSQNPQRKPKGRTVSVKVADVTGDKTFLIAVKTYLLHK